ncbi:MAG TPA: non-homologous end-joining DNA ligase, partial [Dehalococcoidia bacterium]|nr:non-homologous end-joining DNA ligase [Dehalococcoidia bacterium]
MLEQYRKKRDFSRTAEPRPSTSVPRPPGGEEDRAGPLTFVIQKHAARQLHYDFRLELDGVLKSWSVPKGPSLDPKEKRLAVMVEDHPLDYASFEGVIPRGEYGAGQVIVWDSGTYSPDEEAPPAGKRGRLSFHDRAEAEERMRRALAQGKLSVFLRGRKLQGSWALVKMQRGEKDWLLIKHQDGFARGDYDVLGEDRSVLSDLTVEDLKAGRLPDRTQRPAAAALKPDALAGARKAPFPKALSPMLATLTEGPFSDPAWLFEPKLDGVRCVALIREGKVTLLSRHGLDATRQYPSLTTDLARQLEPQLVLDGEIVALDEAGRPSFQVLQQRLNLTREADIRRAEAQVPVLYYVFDLLYLDGYDLCAVPLAQRKTLLAQALLLTNLVRPLDHFDEDGEAAYEAAVGHGLEGVVAKRRDSPYEPGRRSRHWLKVKATVSDEFVVGGYSRGQGGRSDTFGALLLGQYDGAGRLVYVGNVGTGFDEPALAELRRRLDALETSDCPFAEPPPVKTANVWSRPELVAEVKFAQWTQDARLRAPVFLRLRPDKPPAEAHRAEVVPAPAAPALPRPEGSRSLPRDIDDVLAQ